MAGERTWESFSKRDLSLLAAAIVAGCLFPLAMGAGGGESEDVRANRERIEGMTELERRQLEQRFSRYRELPHDERARLRSMHDQIEGDADLSRTVAAYRRWVETLSPIEREELRRESDPTAKLELVRRFRERQQEEERRSRRRPIEYVQRRWGGPRPPKIDDTVRDSMFETLESRLTTDERLRLEKVEGRVQRRVALVRMTIDRSHEPGAPGRPKVLDDETVSALVEALPASPVKSLIESAENVEQERMRVAGLLLIGLWREFSEVDERSKPSSEELWKFFDELPAEDRDRMTSLSRPEVERELTRRYVMHSLRDFESVTRDLKSIMPGGGRPPFGGKPPSGRRPGDGRPGDGRNGDGRNGDGRPRGGRPSGGRGPGGGRPERRPGEDGEGRDGGDRGERVFPNRFDRRPPATTEEKR